MQNIAAVEHVEPAEAEHDEAACHQPVNETLELIEASHHTPAPAAMDGDTAAYREEDRQHGDHADLDDRTPNRQRAVMPTPERLTRLDQHARLFVRNGDVALRAVANSAPEAGARESCGVARLVGRALRVRRPAEQHHGDTHS